MNEALHALFIYAAPASFFGPKGLTILGLRIKNLDNVADQIRQLLVDLDLLLVLLDPLPLAPTLVGDALQIAAHDATVVVEEVEALPELGGRHVAGLVLQFGVEGRLGGILLGGLVVLGLFGTAAGGGGRRGGRGLALVVVLPSSAVIAGAGFAGVAASPDVGSLEVVVVVAHGCVLGICQLRVPERQM